MFLPLLLLKKDRERERIPAQSLPEINVSDKEQVRIVGQEASRLNWSCMFIVLCVTYYVFCIIWNLCCTVSRLLSGFRGFYKGDYINGDRFPFCQQTAMSLLYGLSEQ